MSLGITRADRSPLSDVLERRGAYVMTEPVRRHSMRQFVRNEQESAPVLMAQEVLRIFVAEVCLGFSRAWNPHPSFFSG